VIRALVAGVLLGSTACATERAAPVLPSQDEWLVARARLEQLRETEAVEPTTAIVRLSFREPRTGKTYTSRGAVAVDPHKALRMILVGPGGATALDVWATRERWRFEVPAANLLRRGEAEDDPSLPVGFFRWWFLSPVDGRLLTSVAGTVGERFIVRDGTATIDLTDTVTGAGHRITASRRAGGRVDRLAYQGASLSFREGDHATYDDDATGVHVDVTVESLGDRPDPVAFRDPDQEPTKP
jgi:hypothetical protein